MFAWWQHLTISCTGNYIDRFHLSRHGWVHGKLIVFQHIYIFLLVCSLLGSGNIVKSWSLICSRLLVRWGSYVWDADRKSSILWRRSRSCKEDDHKVSLCIAALNIFNECFRNRVRFPKYLGSEATSFLRELLQRAPEKRLGSGHRGHQDVKDHTFFKGINWDRLYRKEIEPPHKPVIADDLTSNVSLDRFLRKCCLIRPFSSTLNTRRKSQLSRSPSQFPRIVFSKDSASVVLIAFWTPWTTWISCDGFCPRVPSSPFLQPCTV